ncbi:hypothetical protein FKP32DRAFT_1652880 [Trametes sanguinea]|nr:hypothetical protein FKP32DRAFT_1652880 [Trametes sanguinea]
MDGKVVLVDYDKFMNRFVPLPHGQTSPSQASYSAIELEGIPEKPESAMYPALMEKLNTPWLAPGYRFVDTSSKADDTDTSKLRVDGGMYPAADAPERNKNTRWSTMEVFIECKTGNTRGDPFDDTSSDGQASAEERRGVFGQIGTYSYSMFKAQHRTHLFNLIIFGSHARISRWDCGGIVVTKKFNYKTEPEKLLEFIWRLARLDAEHRGHDTSASPVVPGSEEYLLMRSRADNPRYDGENKLQEHARVAFKKSLEHTRWWKLRVDDESDPSIEPKVRYFLVGKPHFVAARGLIGRATRGYVGIDLANPNGPFVYLKDTWRVKHEGIRKEGDILGYLNEQGVENIPTRLCHGDVLPSESDFQATISHVIWKEENPKVLVCTLKAHRHYRLVVEEVCLPMNDFANADELVFFITRCISAHGSAYQKGVMHRDVSAGNVLIFPREYIDEEGTLQVDRDGMLTDWELSKDVEEKPGAKGPRQPDRTGTWQFLSANALANPRKTIGIEDEMESFFHVLLYYACRYLPTNCPDITPFIYDYFDGYAKNGEEYSASMTKHHAMKNGELCVNSAYELVFLTSRPVQGAPTPPRHPISHLFSKLLEILKAQYTLYRLDSKSSYDSTTSAGPSTSKPAQRSARIKDWKAKYLKSKPETPSPLSPESDRELQEEAAAPLKDHALMLEQYMRAWDSSEKDHPWPVADKIPDQMRTNYDPDKEAKDAKPSKSGKDSQVAASNHGSMQPPPPPSDASNTSRKRATLHDDDPFEDPSPKRSATKASTSSSK